MSCQEQINSKYYEIEFHLPEYYQEYDFKSYAKENNINLMFTPIYNSEKFYKDSKNSCFLSFKQFENQDFESNAKFDLLIKEKKEVVESESVGKWININESKKGNLDFALLEYNDTILNSYQAAAYWKLEDNMYRVNFYTDKSNKFFIDDFKKLIKSLKLSN